MSRQVESQAVKREVLTTEQYKTSYTAQVSATADETSQAIYHQDIRRSQTPSPLGRSKTVARNAGLAASRSRSTKVSQQPQKLTRTPAIRRPNPIEHKIKIDIRAGDYATYKPYIQPSRKTTHGYMDATGKQWTRKCTITGPRNSQEARPEPICRPFSFNQGPDIVSVKDTRAACLDTLAAIPETQSSPALDQAARPQSPLTMVERGKFTTHTSILMTSCELSKPGKSHSHLPLSSTADIQTPAITLNNRPRIVADRLDQTNGSRRHEQTLPLNLINKARTAKAMFEKMLRQLQASNLDDITNVTPRLVKNSHHPAGQVGEWKEAVQTVLEAIPQILREPSNKQRDEETLRRVGEFVKDAELFVSGLSSAS